MRGLRSTWSLELPKRFRRAVTGRPWLVIAGWGVAAVAVVVMAPGLDSITNSDQAAFLPRDAESVQADHLAAQAFPARSGATAVTVVGRSDRGPLTAADIEVVRALAGTLAQKGLRATFVPSQMVAPNRSVAMVAIQFSGPAEDQKVRTALLAVRATTATSLAGTGLTAGTTGPAAITVDNKRAFADAEKVVTGATLGLIVLLLLLIFRSPIAALLPLVTVGLVYGVSTALVAAAGRILGFQVGQELPTMLTVVLFGIGTDYILFLLFRYRERLRAGDSPAEAIAAAVDRVGEAIFSAAAAVIAAFGALVLAALGFFTTLGPALAVGVAVMVLAALTLVPAVVTLLGRRVFWPLKQHQPRTGTRFAALGRFVATRPVPVTVGAITLLAVLTVGAFSFRPDYDPINQLPAGMESTVAFDEMQRGFPAGALNPVNVYAHAEQPLTAAQIAGLVGHLAAVPGVATPMAPELSADRLTVVIPLVLKDAPYSDRALDVVSGPVRAAAHRAAPPGATVRVGGQSMAFADVRAATNRDLGLIFPVAGVLFVLILAALLRALLAPLYLVAMVVLGFAATLGTTAWVFQSSQAGLAFSIPIILYLFVTAIGTDYNILMTARLREEIREGRSPTQAAALAIEHAGPSVAAAAAILTGTFGSLLISGVPFFMQIGFAVTLGIVLVAFVVSILLVPAVTALAGRAAWWPGRPKQTEPEWPDSAEWADPLSPQRVG